MGRDKDKIEKLPILTKSADFMDEIYDAIVQYPGAGGFALGADTKSRLYAVLPADCAASKKYYKKTTLHDADVELLSLETFYPHGLRRRYMSIE